jgi:hypothetical protein
MLAKVFVKKIFLFSLSCGRERLSFIPASSMLGGTYLEWAGYVGGQERADN